MKIELYKAYRTRGGWKAVVVTDADHAGDPYPFKVWHDQGIVEWHSPDGKYAKNRTDERDLIAPWEEK